MFMLNSIKPIKVADLQIRQSINVKWRYYDTHGKQFF